MMFVVIVHKGVWFWTKKRTLFAVVFAAFIIYNLSYIIHIKPPLEKKI
jgi:hypothetical protein